MDRSIVYFLLILNIIVAIRYYVKHNCEIPFFLAFFNIMVEYRTVCLETGNAEFVQFDYGLSFEYNLDIAYIVSGLIVLGTTILMYCFIWFYKPKAQSKVRDSTDLFKEFVLTKKKYIIAGLIFFTFFQVVLAGNLSDAYGNMAKLGNCSFIILLFLVMNYTKSKSFGTKMLYLAVFASLAYITYNPGMRFQFLGWMVPVGYYLARNIKPGRKIMFAMAGLFLILIIFSAAGVLRYNNLKDMTLTELYDESTSRLLIAEDINFIDGFMMMYQVYPKVLDYDYGLEHLNILLRPIPRTLWPGKPLAGWFQNYQAKYGIELVTVGFSPTIYGVFYAEMGEIGVVLFSVFWAWVLSYVYRAFTAFRSELRAILVGVLLSAMIPIFRSGDIAGDFAIVLLSYWPLFVFVRQYKKFLRSKAVV